MSDPGSLESPLAGALRRIGDRWTLLVVKALLEQPRRFGELQRSVPGVATNVLSARLRDLERHGLVVAEPYSTRPLRVVYRATARAAELGGVLRLLGDWSVRSGGAEPPVHALCGTTLQVRYYCPTCHDLAEDEEGVWV